ncbi:MAG: hypothetical protein AAGG51_03285 [Cyanobacteria bacterium P01_G01_bin.54]
MQQDRFRQIESNLELLYEQKADLEREVLLSTGIQKTQARQRIRVEINPQIAEYEFEYWEEVSAHPEYLDLSEQDAEIIAREVTGSIEAMKKSDFPEEVWEILEQIRDQIAKSEESASLKIKGIVSTIPPFIGVAHEAEIDIRKFLENNFPTFLKVFRSVSSHKKK